MGRSSLRSISGKGATALDLRNSRVTLILNASPDSLLLNSRAKTLNDAGYYTSSVRTTEEAVHHAASMKCALVLICYSFGGKEKKTLSERLRKLSPGTRIVCLDPELDNNQSVLVSRVEEALQKAECVNRIN
jgi:DNA-binding response OmpR family regulator